ncbi:putative at hook motif protein [Neofusicoccum parvum UCRNP2]|uniref:Putative at hook motif protein n=1 Tax=Botryosphaeria parva (strain UCR-NP2) TaxID=1287680 RepID=R1GL21_BOTPV|nr:putative at hook motif protein [Neofusicoccum parvum UCRNP2]
MAPNDREERRRMRQRGAGTSGLSVGNFGFTFGGPALPAQPSICLRKPSDDASQIDELELPTPSAVSNPRLPKVNAVDILAQITSELTTRMSTALLQQAADVGTADKPRRAELTRRARTVEAFATELADRLFELTEAVDAGEALRARAKAAAKEKVALRAEFLGIRKERDEVALRMDAVRRAHMHAEARRRRDEELNDVLFGIETAVQRGREKA